MDKRSDIVLGRNQNVRYCSRISLIENRLFRFGPESALLDLIEMISFKRTNSGTNSNVLVSFRLDIGRLWNVCETFVPLLFWHYYYWLQFSLCRIAFIEYKLYR